MREFNITTQQARDFAKAIYPNIAQFISSHKDGYETFLESNEPLHENIDEDELGEIE